VDIFPFGNNLELPEVCCLLLRDGGGVNEALPDLCNRRKNQISEFHDFECADDIAATDKAHMLRRTHTAEVWHAFRLVARIKECADAVRI
jgi:hypothetical protein